MVEVKQEDLLKLEMQLTQKQALMNQSQHTMQENIKEIKSDIKEGFKDIKDSVDCLDKKFATKEEHSIGIDRISRIEKIFIWLILLVGAAIVTALLKLVLI